MQITSRKGFTLVELLIVVAIIGILASVVIVGLAPTQRSGRDARRISDIRQVQTALELYYAKCGYYPGTTQAAAACGAFSQLTNDWGEMASALIGSGIGVTNIPNDPLAGKSYGYSSTPDGKGYALRAVLENPSYGTLAADSDGTVLSLDCADPAYCVRQ
jgi:prepilin-type N-terminal cleavage/methylation domain-containing protein